jgi:hypothetical protein
MQRNSGAISIPSVIESRLRERGLDIVALNAGVRGHTTQDSINALLNRPDFVMPMLLC